MTRPRLLTSTLATLVALWLAGAAHAGTPHTLVAKADRVSEGDTVTGITSEGSKLRIRLLGIDVPEVAHGTNLDQPFGEEAREYLDHLTVENWSAWTPTAGTATSASWPWSGMSRSTSTC